jgi:cell division cycle 2-like protein
MSTAAIRKRPATDQAPRVDGGKKPRYSFGRISDYEKLEVLGEGAYGVVMKARDRRTGKKVALKWLRGCDLRSITREAGCLGACRGHPSIIEVLDVATDADTGDFFIVTELVAGGLTLREQIWRPFHEDVARAMMRQLFDAAKKMHGAGIVHRDIKPENVLVTMFGSLKVCDFGSATRQKPAGVPYEECRVGTMIYTSPEQLAGNRYYGQAVDMWALGCLMAEILAGETLFVAKTEEDMVAEISKLRDQISSTGKLVGLEFFDELSEAGRELLIGLLAFNPDERLTAAEALQHRWFSKPSSSAGEQQHPGFVTLFS